MSIYEDMVMKACGCPADRVKDVEHIMRLTYRTLDNIDRRTFFREAKKAWEAVQILDKEGANAGQSAH